MFSRPLRVGLLIDSLEQPLWVRRIVGEIINSEFANVALIVRNLSGGKAADGFAKKLWKNRNHLLYAAYTKFDNRFSHCEPDAFKKVSIEDLLDATPIIEVTPISQKFSDEISDDDFRLIQKFDLDVAIRFGFRILKGRILEIARYGIWSYHHDDGMIYRGSPPGFWEVMEDNPVTGSMLQILNEQLDNGTVIYRSWAPTVNRFSVKKNTNNYYWKSAAFMMRQLKALHETGTVPESNGFAVPYSNRLFKTPGNGEMFRLSLGLTARAAKRAVAKVATKEIWQLAYRFRSSAADSNTALYKFKYLVPPKGRFWADPFPVKSGDRYFVFFEEFLFDTGKAHISAIELKAGEAPSAATTVLERPYHLSYPYVFEYRGQTYMVPESGANGTVELYRATSFPHEWELETVLLEAKNPTDASLIEIEGRWWMFVNIEEPGVLVNWEELHLFHAATPHGPWTPHSLNPIKSDVRNSRPAGRPFFENGVLYRPAQDCSKRYGYATVINEITNINPASYAEKEVARINPSWAKNIIGTHTFNRADDLTVVDCLVKASRFTS